METMIYMFNDNRSCRLNDLQLTLSTKHVNTHFILIEKHNSSLYFYSYVNLKLKIGYCKTAFGMHFFNYFGM